MMGTEHSLLDGAAAAAATDVTKCPAAVSNQNDDDDDSDKNTQIVSSFSSSESESASMEQSGGEEEEEEGEKQSMPTQSCCDASPPLSQIPAAIVPVFVTNSITVDSPYEIYKEEEKEGRVHDATEDQHAEEEHQENENVQVKEIENKIESSSSEEQEDKQQQQQQQQQQEEQQEQQQEENRPNDEVEQDPQETSVTVVVSTDDAAFPIEAPENVQEIPGLVYEAPDGEVLTTAETTMSDLILKMEGSDNEETSSFVEDVQQEDPKLASSSSSLAVNANQMGLADEKLNSSVKTTGEDQFSCPICLTTTFDGDTSGAVFACGPCNHPCCVECLERVVNADASATIWPPIQPGTPAAQAANYYETPPSEEHLAAPTLGRCPICRAELSLFELVNAQTGKILYEKDYDLSPLAGSIYVPYGRRDQRRVVGYQSYHFDEIACDGNGDKKTMVVPYFNIGESIQYKPEVWHFDDGSGTAPPKKYLDPDSCHFHKQSRTFHGSIVWGNDNVTNENDKNKEPIKHRRIQGSYKWDVILAFSKDYRFVTSGIIHKRKEFVGVSILPKQEGSTKQQEESTAIPGIQRTNSKTQEEKFRCQFPLDGRWKVKWMSKGVQRENSIVVVGNMFEQSSWPFFLTFHHPKHISFKWPKSTTIQTAISGIDLDRQPMGPEIGQRIRWTTPNSSFPKIDWIRETIRKLPPPHKVVCFGPGPRKWLYQRLHDAGIPRNIGEDSIIPTYNKSSIWGNVFCKRLRVGSASYHFLSPERGGYVSYEHPTCQDLPPLDDGTPLPTRVNFHNIVYDPETRNVTASVDWESDFGTSWNDNVCWKMDMTFDSEYTCILRGGIQCEWSRERRAPPRPRRPPPPSRPAPVAIYVPPPEDETTGSENGEDNIEEEKVEIGEEDTAGAVGSSPSSTSSEREEANRKRNEEWLVSCYGADQLYVNAALFERFRYQDEEVSDLKRRFIRIANSVTQRLQKEGATERTLQIVEQVFRNAVEVPDEYPIDYNIN